MSFYRTSEVARTVGVHPNTVRLYEKLGFISKPNRKSNGYRVFEGFHIEQLRFARRALKVEILQKGLRKQAINIIKTSAAKDYNSAICLTKHYLQQLKREQKGAEEAIAVTEKLLSGEGHKTGNAYLTRKETADHLHITMDALRNWEMNGLLTVKRKQNGYRVYTNEDIQRLKIIRCLRFANYSLAAILRMFNALSDNPKAASLGLPVDSVLMPVIIMAALALVCTTLSLRFFK